MKTISIVHKKGGAGKTTLAYMLASGALNLGAMHITPTGKPIYSDGVHLSIYGSEYIVNSMHEDGILTKLSN